MRFRQLMETGRVLKLTSKDVAISIDAARTRIAMLDDTIFAEKP
jgi:hypothetical protein